MKSITLLDLKQHTEFIIRSVAQGEAVVIKYRGKPAVRLEPISQTQNKKTSADPFYSLTDLAAKGGNSLTNEEMDKLVYGA